MDKRFWAVALALTCVATAPACTGSTSADGKGSIPFVAVDPKSASPTDQAIAKAQKKLRAEPDDLTAQLALAQAFLQKARETADPTYYTKAASLLDDLQKTTEPSVSLKVTQATLALAQHRFRDGLALGKEARSLAPGSEGPQGVLVDANNELGNYDAALKAGEDMVDAKPNLASLSRASYARELRGDLDGAILAMSQAETSAGGATGENIAYVQVLLGNLLLTRGDLVEAERAYRRADRSFAGFPAAMVGQSQVLVAQEQYAEAAKLLAKPLDVQPLDTTAIAQGDAYLRAGQKGKAQDAYDLVGVIAKLYRANGVNVDLELALFDADHNPGKDSVAAARKALQSRPSILGHDVLAWNLFRAGDEKAAAKEDRKALTTGSRDPVLRFHAAAIADANGDRTAAKRHLKIVLDTNPRFSAFLTPEVKALAKKLGLEMPPVPTVPQQGP